MIDFSLPEKMKVQNKQLEMVAEHLMRPYSRKMDEEEHDKPWDFINATWQQTSSTMSAQIAKLEKKLAGDTSDISQNGSKSNGNSAGNSHTAMAHMIEILSWG